MAEPPGSSENPPAASHSPSQTPVRADRESGSGKKRKKGKHRRGPGGGEPTAAAPPEDETAPDEAQEGPDDETEMQPAAPGVVVPPKHHVKAAVVPELGGDPFLDTARSTIEKLRENWTVLAAGLMVVIVAIIFFALKVESGKTRNREAWEALHKLEAGGATPDADEFLKRQAEFGGTTAEPFFTLRAADARLQAGGRENAQAAVELYERVQKDFASNAVAVYLATKGLEVAKSTVAFDPAKALKKDKVEMAKDLPKLPEAPAPPTATATPPK